ncbi:MAG: hypothetical protein HRU36_04995 [Rickettsiales bacterium]|nr:hypothetical protein [Rickettsiales bacterium]
MFENLRATNFIRPVVFTAGVAAYPIVVDFLKKIDFVELGAFLIIGNVVYINYPEVNVNHRVALGSAFGLMSYSFKNGVGKVRSYFQKDSDESDTSYMSLLDTTLGVTVTAISFELVKANPAAIVYLTSLMPKKSAFFGKVISWIYDDEYYYYHSSEYSGDISDMIVEGRRLSQMTGYSAMKDKDMILTGTVDSGVLPIIEDS